MKRRTKRKIKNFILKTLAFIAIFNIMLFVSAIDSLTTNSLIQGLIVNGVAVFYLYILAYANGWIYNTDPYYEREEKEALNETR